MLLHALNWLNIAQMNLFSRRQIIVAVVVDVGWMGVKCELWVQQCFIVPFTDQVPVGTGRRSRKFLRRRNEISRLRNKTSRRRNEISWRRNKISRRRNETSWRRNEISRRRKENVLMKTQLLLTAKFTSPQRNLTIPMHDWTSYVQCTVTEILFRWKFWSEKSFHPERIFLKKRAGAENFVPVHTLLKIDCKKLYDARRGRSARNEAQNNCVIVS